MKHLGETPPFVGADGKVVADSIAEVHTLRLGGVDQWVMIRGENIANPPLVLLHGGPGLSETPLFRAFNAPLERAFTVVYWDQRGAGKSYDPKIPPASMTTEQFLADLGQLVDFVRHRLGKQKVVLYGHSWGSALGVIYAARFPEKVAAYVGSGQIGDTLAGERASYEYALAEAQRQKKRRAVKKLQAIGPPPYGAEGLWTERIWLNRLEGVMRPRNLWNMGRVFLSGPESSVRELPRIMRGFKWSIDTMWPESSRIDLTRLVPELKVPVFFFLGRLDHWVPPEASMAYFETLRAPSKRLVWFERSGHEPFADEPAKFNAAMRDMVRPLAA